MIYVDHLLSLLKHKWYVLKSGLMIGNIPLWRLIIHDLSKFSPTEFMGYAGNIRGSKNKNSWATAWLHHLHHNPHHPEHWLLSWRGESSFYDDVGEKVSSFVVMLPMPETYVREMVADLLATSKQVTGYWDIANWINTNGPNMILHESTVNTFGSIMIETDYFLTDNCDWSYMAGSKFRKWAKEFQ